MADKIRCFMERETALCRWPRIRGCQRPVLRGPRGLDRVQNPIKSAYSTAKPTRQRYMYNGSREYSVPASYEEISPNLKILVLMEMYVERNIICGFVSLWIMFLCKISFEYCAHKVTDFI